LLLFGGVLAAPFGLPTLLVESIEDDPCYDKSYFDAVEASIPLKDQDYPGDVTYQDGPFYFLRDSRWQDPRFGRSLDAPQVQRLRSDMCAWRQVSVKAWKQQAMQVTLQVCGTAEQQL
jgi:hypothetical protein